MRDGVSSPKKNTGVSVGFSAGMETCQTCRSSHTIFKHSAACPLAETGLMSSPMVLGPILECSLERRASVRYKLRLPVIFHWDDGTEHTAGGFTSDVAQDGALILSTKCPPVGSAVRIEVLLPSLDQSGEEIRIECSGKVTRINEHAGCCAFEVHGTFDDDHLTRHVLM
jgi:hypothetical protein